MHYTGTIWRPPYEWDSLLLEATAGCTHRACKFCTLYDELPFKFRGPIIWAPSSPTCWKRKRCAQVPMPP